MYRSSFYFTYVDICEELSAILLPYCLEIVIETRLYVIKKMST